MTTQLEDTLAAPATISVTIADGGIETALTDRLGQELPEFAAFVLLETAAGRDALRAYYAPFIELAAEQRLPLVLDTPTWRANPDWGARVGADAGALDRANADAVAFVREVIEESGTEGSGGVDTLVNGCVGPRFDEYVANERMTEAEAEHYHAPQITALAEAGADRVTAVTMVDAAEAIGIVRAAGNARIPVAVSFAVGPDGLLGDGSDSGERDRHRRYGHGRCRRRLPCQLRASARGGTGPGRLTPGLRRWNGCRLPSERRPNWVTTARAMSRRRSLRGSSHSSGTRAERGSVWWVLRGT